MSESSITYTVHPVNKSLNLLPKERISAGRVQAWLTLDDSSSLCAPTPLEQLAPHGSTAAVEDIIVADPGTQFQTMLGLGGTIIDSDTYNLLRLNDVDRTKAINALVSPKQGLGFNLMRIPFGTTDWNRDWDFYSYCDQKDPTLESFSISRDAERGQLKIIKEFLAANSQIKLLASVWGLPPWMKTNHKLIHGLFDSAYTDIYADYLIKCLQAYEKQGIPVDFITSQNEPGTADDRNTPATMWHWQQQRDITLALRQRIEVAGLRTKIWAFDHNFDMAQVYVKPMLDDVRVRAAIDAVAFHDYRGRAEEMSLLHTQFPEIPVVLTERARGTLPAMLKMMDCFRNWAIGHISWTTVTDDRGGPHQYAGGHEKVTPTPKPFRCHGILTIPSAEPTTFIPTISYYYYAHFTKFILRGAVRIATNSLAHDHLNNVAYQNPDGSISMVVANNGEKGLDMAFQLYGAAYLFHLAAKSMITLVVSG